MTLPNDTQLQATRAYDALTQFVSVVSLISDEALDMTAALISRERARGYDGAEADFLAEALTLIESSRD